MRPVKIVVSRLKIRWIRESQFHLTGVFRTQEGWPAFWPLGHGRPGTSSDETIVVEGYVGADAGESWMSAWSVFDSAALAEVGLVVAGTEQGLPRMFSMDVFSVGTPRLPDKDTLDAFAGFLDCLPEETDPAEGGMTITRSAAAFLRTKEGRATTRGEVEALATGHLLREIRAWRKSRGL